MTRLGTLAIVLNGLFLAPGSYAQSTDDARIIEYVTIIEQLISVNQIEAARDKLAEANAANLRDESLDVIQSQLRLLESLNATSDSLQPAPDTGLSDLDLLAVTDLLDSLRVAMENVELEKVQGFTDATPRTATLLNAVFKTYTALKVQVSKPQADESNQSFSATLEIKEMTTKDGSTAFPAEAWKTHQLRIVKADGSWQKIQW